MGEGRVGGGPERHPACTRIPAGAAPSILAWGLPVYVAAVGACCLAALAVPRYAALSVAAGAVLALPRLFVYDVTLVAAAAAPEGDGPR